MKFYPFTLEDLDGEIWKWIRGYEGDYQESNYGRTKNFKNGIVRIMKPTITKHGYLKINLRELPTTKVEGFVGSLQKPYSYRRIHIAPTLSPKLQLT